LPAASAARPVTLAWPLLFALMVAGAACTSDPQVDPGARSATTSPSSVPPSPSPTENEGYVNPTSGGSLALQIEDMHLADVIADIRYTKAGGGQLMDVYHPQDWTRGGPPLPAVLLGGSGYFSGDKGSGQKTGWAQLIAASGLAAVIFDTRSDDFLENPQLPSEDIAAAISYVRNHAERLGIDSDRICTLGFSYAGPWHLWAALHKPVPYVKCNILYYAPLDFKNVDFVIAPADAREFSPARMLQSRGGDIPPMLIVEAGSDDPSVNNSIKRFVRLADELGAPVELLTHPRADSGFDEGRSLDKRTEEIMRETLAFFRRHLGM
jgi:acetyl esterase/lipase